MVHRERMKELMCYLWDNYLELHDSEHVVLMGVGDSYSAVRELLVNRGKVFFCFCYLVLVSRALGYFQTLPWIIPPPLQMSTH